MEPFSSLLKSQKHWYEEIVSKLDSLSIQMKKMKQSSMEMIKLEINYQEMMHPFQ